VKSYPEKQSMKGRFMFFMFSLLVGMGYFSHERNFDDSSHSRSG
jgi:hypothetical protein